jgi:alpha-N-arabinofuranosidase
MRKEYFVDKAKYVLDKDYVIGEIDRRLFGSFAEHLGRTVYNGLYEPGHPLADEQGFRKDVLQAVKDAGITLVRYPGGNFASGYDWKDGIGPIDRRPKRRELAWTAIETNKMGTDEFADWSCKAGVEFMGTVNLGTGTIQSAGDIVDYCNLESGTEWSDLRRRNGHAEPHNVKLWCLGNEMDGPWQIGALSPEDYAKKALEAAKIMKWTDPSIELVACGSCCCETPTYPDWDRLVLERVYDKIEYLSLHRYYTYVKDRQLFYRVEDDRSDVPFAPVDMEAFLHTVISAADLTKSKLKSSKTINISCDEWNVISSTPLSPPRVPWKESYEDGEDVFNVVEALVCGGLLCAFVHNADRVKIAGQSLLVNVGGMFYTKVGGGLVKNTTFYPFRDMATYARGVALFDKLSCPSLKTNHHGEAPALKTAASYDETTGSLNVFVVNYSASPIELDMDMRSFGKVEGIEHIVLAGDRETDMNSFAEPDKVAPRSAKLGKTEGGKVSVVLPGASWNTLRFSAGREA